MAVPPAALSGALPDSLQISDGHALSGSGDIGRSGAFTAGNINVNIPEKPVKLKPSYIFTLAFLVIAIGGTIYLAKKKK